MQGQEEEVVAGYGVICGVRAVRSWDADMGSGGRDYIPYYQAFTSSTTPCSSLQHSNAYIKYGVRG